MYFVYYIYIIILYLIYIYMRLIILYTVSPLACFLHISYDDTQHLGCPAPGSAHCRCPAAGERPGPAALDQLLDGLTVLNGG